MRPLETAPTSRLLVLAAIIGVALFLAGKHGCRPDRVPPVDPGSVVENEPPAPGESGEEPGSSPADDSPLAAQPCLDGLPQAVFDNALRIRNRSGSGSGNVVEDLGDEYEIETNHHVAGRRGTPNVIDIWIGGDLVASRPSATVQSWFRDGKSKDVAVLRVKKSDLGGPLPVIPTAPKGWVERVVAGDKVFTVGCQSGQTPRARCGNVVKHENGLIWYEPESIPGDSGSAVYMQDSETGAWYAVGRTAWAIQEPGSRKWLGLAMDSDRVRAIRAGEVSDGWELPAGAKPIELIGNDPPEADPVWLPTEAVRLDLMGGPEISNLKSQISDSDPADGDPQPLPVSLRRWSASGSGVQPQASGLLPRLLGDHENRIRREVRASAMPIRSAIAGMFWLVGAGVAVGVAFLILDLRRR